MGLQGGALLSGQKGLESSQVRAAMKGMGENSGGDMLSRKLPAGPSGNAGLPYGGLLIVTRT